jgi:cytochrome c oxidase subunit IV
MAENTHHTSPHDPADHGHHGHHILSAGLLLRTFGALVLFTIITVALAFAERNDIVHFGEVGSVAVALFIAGIKATLVAMFFMALKYDNKVNALAFLMGIVFLAVFFVFTFLDTGFRGQWEFGAFEGRTVDEALMEQRRAEQAEEALQGRFQPPVAAPGDTVLLGPPPPVQ